MLYLFILCTPRLYNQQREWAGENPGKFPGLPFQIDSTLTLFVRRKLPCASGSGVSQTLVRALVLNKG